MVNKLISTIIIPILLFTACEFQPLYQQQHTAKHNGSSSVKLEVKSNNEEAYSAYKFKQELKPYLSTYANTSKLKKITIHLHEDFGNIGYGADASVLRSQLKLSATIELYSTNHQLLYKNKLDVVSSYTDDNAEEFSNLSARMATRERLISYLVQDVAREIQSAIHNNFKFAAKSIK